MAYRGSTAASSLTNPPRCLIPHMGGIVSSAFSSATNVQRQQGGGLWFYSSTHSAATVAGSNFFTDGKKLGMKPGDILIGNVFSTAGSTPATYIASVKSVSSSGATIKGVAASS